MRCARSSAIPRASSDSGVESIPTPMRCSSGCGASGSGATATAQARAVQDLHGVIALEDVLQAAAVTRADDAAGRRSRPPPHDAARGRATEPLRCGYVPQERARRGPPSARARAPRAARRTWTEAAAGGCGGRRRARAVRRRPDAMACASETAPRPRSCPFSPTTMVRNIRLLVPWTALPAVLSHGRSRRRVLHRGPPASPCGSPRMAARRPRPMLGCTRFAVPSEQEATRMSALRDHRHCRRPGDRSCSPRRCGSSSSTSAACSSGWAASRTARAGRV